MPLLSNLAVVQPYVPKMADVANLILNYLGRAYNDYKVIACEKAAVEVALFGWCHVTKKQHIFHYHPDTDDNGSYVIKCTHYTDLSEKSFVYLGDYSMVIKQKIQQAFDGDNDPGKSRIPRKIIEEHIQNSEYKTIGGDLHLGIANQFGFQPYCIVKPRLMGQPEAYLSYLGYELYQDIQNVGCAFVSLPGMC